MPNEVAGDFTSQTAAEPVQPATDVTDTAAETTEEQVSQAGEKQDGDEVKLTQDEVNRLIKNRLAKAERKYSQRATELEAQVQAYRQLLDQQKATAPKADAPSGDDAPKRDAFETYEEYIEARAEWRAMKAAEKQLATLREQQTKSAEAQRQAEVAEQFNEREESFRRSHDDYDDVVGHIRGLPKHVVDFIAEADEGPAVLYALGNDSEALARIKSLSPARAAVELARLATANAAPKPKQVSKAPEPVKPMAAKSSDASAMPSDSDPIDVWVKKEQARIAAQRNRFVR